MESIDIKKLETAIIYLQRIAEGNNPINNMPAYEDTVLNDPNVIRCKLDHRRGGTHYSEALNYPLEMPDGTMRYPGGNSIRPEDGWNVYNKRYAKVDNSGDVIERTIRKVL